MRAAFSAIGLALTAACSGGDPAQPGSTPTSILIDLPRAALSVGESAQATATVFDARAEVIPRATIRWSSSNATVATIGSTGIITAASAGRATIRAAAGSAGASVDLIVDASDCTAPLTLAVGDVRVLSGPTQARCLTIAGVTPSEYIVVTANARAVSDDIREYVVSAWPARASTTTVRQDGRRDATLATMTGGVTSDREATLRATERRLIAGRRPARLAAPSARRSAAEVRLDPPRVGDTLAYRVADIAAADPCSRFETVRAIVKAVGSTSLIVQDVSAPANGFDESDFRAIANEFDRLVVPTHARWFGSPTDINGDGHVTILYTPAVNRLTPPGAGNYVGGFFFGVDLFARVIPSEGWRCDTSNEQEIFFMLAPDPLGTINGNRRSVASVRADTRGTIAHELQHMINQGVRQSDPRVDSLEVAWLDEGLSHFAEEAVGRAALGKGDITRLSSSDVMANLDDYQAFIWPNLVRLRAWMRAPDRSSAISSRVDVDIAPRGAAWAFVRYTADVYGRADASAFVRRLVAGPEVGIRNLEQRSGARFDEVLPGFLIASYGELGASPHDARYRYASWALRDVMSTLNGGAFPLAVGTLPGDARVQTPAGSGGYFQIQRPAGSTPVTIRLLSPTGTPLDAGAGVYVLRVR